MKHDIKDLINIKESVEQHDKTSELPFHEKFKQKWSMEQPLKEWCYDAFKDACKKTIGHNNVKHVQMYSVFTYCFTDKTNASSPQSFKTFFKESPESGLFFPIFNSIFFKIFNPSLRMLTAAL